MITATLHHLEIPFLRAFGHALATRDRAEAIVLVLDDAEGEAEGDGDSDSDGSGGRWFGVGECVPRAYVTGETFASVWNGISQLELSELWKGIDHSSRAQLVHSVERLRLPELLRGPGPAWPLGLAAACAVELALLDLACRKNGWRLAELAFELGLPPALLSREPLSEIPSVPLDFTRQPGELAPLVGSKLGHLKVKVGAELCRDVRRLRECRELFGASFSISVDANMSWSLDEALRAAEAFAPLGLAWCEEPLRQSERAHYAELRERGGLAIMLDEAACGFEQAAAAVAAGACDLLNIRISKCGGFLASLRLVELAAAHGVRCQHGAQVGQLGFLNAAGRHLTSTVRGLVACEGGPGLANLGDFPTQQKLELDWTAGHLVGLSGAGLGASPDRAKLARYSTRIATWNGTRWC